MTGLPFSIAVEALVARMRDCMFDPLAASTH
jgi:hypothetical protein